MKSPSFSLVVIRTANTEASLSFYGALGLEFAQEQHGTGPVHYSCDLGGVVLEIYPGQEGQSPEPRAGGATMLGFHVAALNETLVALKQLNIEPKTAPKDAEWGRWVNVTDPDGRVVQLTQPI
jgi:lactoylglutathione lyase